MHKSEPFGGWKKKCKEKLRKVKNEWIKKIIFFYVPNL